VKASGVSHEASQGKHSTRCGSPPPIRWCSCSGLSRLAGASAGRPKDEQQVTITHMTASAMKPNGGCADRVYLVERIRGSVRCVAPESFASERDGATALGLVSTWPRGLIWSAERYQGGCVRSAIRSKTYRAASTCRTKQATKQGRRWC
jgi:hypothetical protein